MDRLAGEILAEFRRAASAALAARERMELLREQAVRAEGGSMPLDPARSRAMAAPGEDLGRALRAVMGARPHVAAVRFRGHIFSLLAFNGMSVLNVLPESAVADVEG